MKQHYVPECYLKGFSDSNGFLSVLNLAGLKRGWKVKPTIKNVSGICYSKDYYEVPKSNHPPTFPLNELPKTYIEDEVLGINESTYPRVRDMFTSGESLSINDYGFLSDFIIQLKLRNPSWRLVIDQKIQTWLDDSFSKSMMKLDEHPRFKQIPEPLRSTVAYEILHRYKSDVDITTKLSLQSLIERRIPGNANNIRVRNALLSSCWTMLELTQTSQVHFITSDNPGFSFTSSGQVVNNLFAGEFTFMLPLTSRHCLKISSKGNPSQTPALGYLALNTKAVLEFEAVLLNVASSQVINKLIISERESELSYLLKILKFSMPQES